MIGKFAKKINCMHKKGKLKGCISLCKSTVMICLCFEYTNLSLLILPRYAFANATPLVDELSSLCRTFLMQSHENKTIIENRVDVMSTLVI